MALPSDLLAEVERGLAPVDAVRRALYRVGAPWLGAWIRDREVRIGLQGLSVVCVSFLGAVLAPLWMLALTPLVLGVPHLVADLRYLVARPGLHRRPGAWAVGGLLVATGVTADLRLGLLAVVVAAVMAAGSLPRRVLVAAVPAVLIVGATLAAGGFAVTLAHVHNAIAVVLWFLLSAALHGGRSARAVRTVPAVAVFAGAAALLSGALDPLLLTDWRVPGAPAIRGHARTLAPGLDPVWATRWVVVFAYAQAVHYGLWLRVVPEECRRRPAPRSFKAGLRALRSDLGDPIMALAVLASVFFAVWGLLDVGGARLGYLSLAYFHGPLELAVLAVVAVEGPRVLRQ